MEELFEYMIPLSGIFTKKRSPRVIESYKKLANFNEIVEDFKIAESFLDDSVRIGEKCIFRKEQITTLYVKDVAGACFRTHGSDASDEFGSIDLIFRDGSEEVLYRTSEIDGRKVAKEVFAALEKKGIETRIIVTR